MVRIYLIDWFVNIRLRIGGENSKAHHYTKVDCFETDIGVYVVDVWIIVQLDLLEMDLESSFCCCQ